MIAGLNTFLLGIISILMVVQVFIFKNTYMQTKANAAAIVELLTRCHIYHGTGGKNEEIL